MSKAFEANGIITLMTDFGVQGPFVGVMKGVILGRFPQAKLVDLTHGIQAYWPAEAGFWLSRSFAYFPAGTVHVAVVDPGVGTARKILIVELEGHVFLAPDNGLLSALLVRHASARIHSFEPARLSSLALPVASATFHGRDIFAPLAAELAQGRVRTSDLGPVRLAQIDPATEAVVRPEGVAGVIITIDRFGNLITNIDGACLAGFEHPVLRSGPHDFRVVRTYGDAEPGERVALVNAFGVIEIAQIQGEASAALGLTRGASIMLTEAGVR